MDQAFIEEEATVEQDNDYDMELGNIISKDQEILPASLQMNQESGNRIESLEKLKQLEHDSLQRVRITNQHFKFDEILSNINQLYQAKKDVLAIRTRKKKKKGKVKPVAVNK